MLLSCLPQLPYFTTYPAWLKFRSENPTRPSRRVRSRSIRSIPNKRQCDESRRRLPKAATGRDVKVPKGRGEIAKAVAAAREMRKSSIQPVRSHGGDSQVQSNLIINFSNGRRRPSCQRDFHPPFKSDKIGSFFLWNQHN